MRRIIPYLLLIIASAIIRFAYVHVVPVSLSHDEVDMIIQAHSFRLTGSDLNQHWVWWRLMPNDAAMAELGPVVNALALSILPNSLFAAHATTALLSSLYPALIVILLLRLGWSSKSAWFAGILLTISPWHILFSRTSLEQPTSLFFYTLSWLALTKVFDKQSTRHSAWLATLGFFLAYTVGFYSYHGYKFSLPLLTFILAAYLTWQHQMRLRGIWVCAYILLLLLRILMGGTAQYASRQSEIMLLNNAKFTSQVDHDRRIATLPPRLTSFLSNKPMAMGAAVVQKYLTVLNPTTIFARGEANGVFGTGRTGYLYLVLLPLVGIGIVELIKDTHVRSKLLLLMLAASPTSTIIHVNDSLAFRSGMYFVMLTIVAAIGLERLSRYTKVGARVSWGLIGISFVQFALIYVGFYPSESARAYFFSDRLLATYLSHRQGQKILVIDPQPRYLMSYLVLTKATITRADLEPLLTHFDIAEGVNQYVIGGLTIRRDCPPDNQVYDTVVLDSTLAAGLTKCPAVLSTQGLEQKAIADPVDSGTNKIIYGDQICPDVTRTYLHPTSLDTFALESLSRVQFCENWIVKP